MASKADQFEQLSAYLDGELTAEQRQAVEEWLEREPEARRLLDELRRVSGMLAHLPRDPAPGDLANSVKTRFEREALLGETMGRSFVKGPILIRWAMRLGAAAVLAIGATVAWYAVEPRLFQPAGETVAFSYDGKQALPQMAEAHKESESDAVEDGAVDEVNRAEAVAAAPLAAEAPSAKARARRVRPPRDEAEWAAGEKLASRGGQGTKHGDRLEEVALASRGEGHVGRGISAGRKISTLDAKLRNNRLTRADLRNIKEAAATNIVSVETDRLAAGAMAEMINGFMYTNGIPLADSSTVPEPIPSEQLFYFNVARPASEDEDMESPAESQSEVYVMNVHPQQAELLLVSLQSFATLNRSEVEWRANWVGDEEPQSVQEIIRSIGQDLNPPKAVACKKGTDGLKALGEAETRAVESAAYEEEDAEGEGATSQPGHVLYGTVSDSDDTAPITLAVEIRARGVSGANRLLQFPPSRGFATAPTSQPAEEANTTTRPTSQRSEGD